MNLNRVVAVASTVIGLSLAVLPVAGNMDWQSTAGIVAGIVAVLGVTQKWLGGWQKHEANVADHLGAAGPYIAAELAHGDDSLDLTPPANLATDRREPSEA